MLAKDSLFQNLPASLNPRQRLELEAIGFAIGSVRYAYGRLKQAAMELASTPPEGRLEFDPTPLFVNAWSVIDSVRQARELVRSLDPKNERLKAYLTEAEPACLLRNKADHIHQNIPNLSKRAGSSHAPLFGALSFAIVEDRHLVVGTDGVTRAAGLRGFAIVSGKPVASTQHLVSHPGSEPIERPIGLLRLDAFDHLVSLSGLAFATERVAQAFEEVLRPLIEAAVRKEAAGRGLDAEQLLREVGGGVIAEVEIMFGD